MWIIHRLCERSTYVGLAGLIGTGLAAIDNQSILDAANELLDLHLTPGKIGAAVTLGAAVSGALIAATTRKQPAP